MKFDRVVVVRHDNIMQNETHSSVLVFLFLFYFFLFLSSGGWGKIKL